VMKPIVPPSPPPPYTDPDCHRPTRLEDYTHGWMVKQRVIGASSQWQAVFSDEEEARTEAEYVREMRLDNGQRKYVEVSLWHNGRPVEIWQNGKPMMAKVSA
jgi:hypothetical protein